jgi:uncharacterized membrane protein YccC
VKIDSIGSVGGIAIWRPASVWRALGPAALFGLRLWAAVTLALFVAYWLELDNAYWAATSASIVCQPILGAALRKGRFRAIGTMVGAIFAVALTSLFPQGRDGFLLGLALWCGVCGFLATILRNFAGYAAALAGYSAAIIFTGAVNHPADTFHVATTRATEICIGILSAGLVQVLTDFGGARIRLIHALATTARDIATGMARTVAMGVETRDTRLVRRELIRRVIALDGTIDQAIGEASDLRARARLLHGAVEGLFMALSGWRGMANHLDAMAEADRAAAAATILPVIRAAAEADWLGTAARTRGTCDTAARQVAATETSDVAARILVDGAATALSGLGRAANGLVLVTELGRERPDQPGGRFHLPDALPAIIGAARVLLALLAVEILWVQADWSGGQDAISFAAIGVMLYSPRAEAGYDMAVGWTVGTVISAGLAAILDFAVFPAQHGFAAFAVALGLIMVPFGALAAGTWQPGVFTALVANFFPLLAPANQPIYDPSSFYNTALSIIVGAIVATVSLRLIPPLGAQRRTARLMKLTLRDLRRLCVRSHWQDHSTWLGRISHKLAALPSIASLDDAAQLLAALSVGHAVIVLRDTRSGLHGPRYLDRALACLALADVEGTRRALSDYGAQQVAGASRPATAQMRALAAAAVVSEALTRHAEFFAATR